MSTLYHDTVQAISDILKEKYIDGEADGLQFTAETRLLSSGLNLDSVAILALLLEVETRFAVQFEDSDLSVELFQSIGNLAKGVMKKIDPRVVPAEHSPSRSHCGVDTIEHYRCSA